MALHGPHLKYETFSKIGAAFHFDNLPSSTEINDHQFSSSLVEFLGKIWVVGHFDNNHFRSNSIAFGKLQFTVLFLPTKYSSLLIVTWAKEYLTFKELN